MIQLTEEQEKHILSDLSKYKKEFAEELRDWDKDRDDRCKLFQSTYGKDNIDKLSEDTFRSSIKQLWSFRGWTNKDYRVDNILRDNSFSKVKEQLKGLLHGDDPISDRIDNFNLKYIGPSSITEILLLVYPDKYCLWNKRAREVF